MQGVSIYTLRRLDRNGSYPALRARDVQGIKSDLPLTRLYPANAEAEAELQMAILRTETRTSRLTGSQISRKHAATKLGVPQSKLRYWERRGMIQPTRSGRIVVYDEACLDSARRLIDRRA